MTPGFSKMQTLLQPVALQALPHAKVRNMLKRLVQAAIITFLLSLMAEIRVPASNRSNAVMSQPIMSQPPNLLLVFGLHRLN